MLILQHSMEKNRICLFRGRWFLCVQQWLAHSVWKGHSIRPGELHLSYPREKMAPQLPSVAFASSLDLCSVTFATFRGSDYT